VVPLERLHEEKYGRILCYPRYDPKESGRRVRELKALGVRALEFTGEKTIYGVSVLGKGYVGVVVVATMDERKVALKIRRVDADRTGMQYEAEMLRKANSVDVGPSLIDATENFLIMEFVEGTLLPKWAEEVNGRVKSRIRRVLRAVLEQCWRLDEISLDHGELSRAPKHIIVKENDKPCMIDFETASLSRRVSNVTSICQYLFIGSHIAKMIANRVGEVDREGLIKALREYKQMRTQESFERVLDVCGLRKV
jgi:putative serine/threonine protein kinase